MNGMDDLCPAATVNVKRGNRLGKPFEVYASNADGTQLVRVDYATLAAARASARALSKRMGWASREAKGLDAYARDTRKRGGPVLASTAALLKPFAGLLPPARKP